MSFSTSEMMMFKPFSCMAIVFLRLLLALVRASRMKAFFELITRNKDCQEELRNACDEHRCESHLHISVIFSEGWHPLVINGGTVQLPDFHGTVLDRTP